MKHVFPVLFLSWLAVGCGASEPPQTEGTAAADETAPARLAEEPASFIFRNGGLARNLLGVA